MPTTAPEHPPLVRAMLRPAFYPHRPARVRLVQTHVSWVFLAGGLVYKVKKPVDFGFLDFSTPARRARACAAEVALNRRLAPGVYLGVAGIRRRGDAFSLSPPGRVVERAVVMRRLPADRLLSALLARRAATAADLRRVARRLAAFHAAAAPAAPRWRGVAALERTLRENFRQTLPFLGRTVTDGDYLLVWDYNHDFLERRRALLERRVRDGHIRDGHGDLHAGNICLLPGGRVVAYDCIEFSPRLRQGDCAADVAFLYMDLLHHGRRDLAGALMEEYLRRTGDWEVRLLVPFYACYRAVVREKVESFSLADPGLPRSRKAAAARRAASYFRLARDLARRDARPRLILVGGLPGSGKSTVAAALAERAGAAHLNSDVLRKELAGESPGARLPAAVGAGIYAPAMTEMTYRELLARAERDLRAGRSVVLDASFRRARDRRRAAALARATAALLVEVECRCPARVARGRLEARARDRAAVSDAGWTVYRAMRRGFEPFGPGAVRVVTTRPLERSLARIAASAWPL
jgi:aminoglycoside phosphotransferase family enzyme/predicted kinase